MRLFRKRRGGRHALGAAVRGLPVAPPAPMHVPLPDTPYGGQPAFPVELPPAVLPGPRVELGFRDGSTAALSPDSAQARALTALAEILVQRD